MKNKIGLSGVITAMLMIGLVMAATLIVWGIIRNIVEEQVESTESCFDIFEKITINNDYTCYNSTSKEMQVSINVKNIAIDKILVSIYGGGSTKSFELYDGFSNENVKSYGVSGQYGVVISIPGENSGLTYIMKEFDTIPESVKIAPIINDNQCEVSDSVFEIITC